MLAVTDAVVVTEVVTEVALWNNRVVSTNNSLSTQQQQSHVTNLMMWTPTVQPPSNSFVYSYVHSKF